MFFRSLSVPRLRNEFHCDLDDDFVVADVFEDNGIVNVLLPRTDRHLFDLSAVFPTPTTSSDESMRSKKRKGQEETVSIEVGILNQ